MAKWAGWWQGLKFQHAKIWAAMFLIAMVVWTCTTPGPTKKAPFKKTPSEGTKTTRPKPYRVNGYWYQPLPHARDFKERGIASWYGKDFHGKRTSNGETYNMYAMTAAHKTLPLGVFVRVTNLSNGKSIKVRINDRGPFVQGRVIDLSYTAAQKLDIVGPGTAPVEVVALGAPPAPGSTEGKDTYTKVDFFSGKFTIQVGAYAEKVNAQNMQEKLQGEYEKAHIVAFDKGDKTYYRVRVGKYTTLDTAEHFERKLINDGYRGAFIVAE